jgi:hypothetical protein
MPKPNCAFARPPKPRRNNGSAIAQMPDDDLVLVYLVELDGTGEPDPLQPSASEGRTP